MVTLKIKLENKFINNKALKWFRAFFVFLVIPLIGFSQWNPANPTIPAPGDCISAYRICDVTQTYNFELLNAGVIDDANGSLAIPGLNKSTPTAFESKSCFIEFTPQYSGQFGLYVCPESVEDLTLILFHNPNCGDLQTGNYSIVSIGGTYQTPDACKGIGLNPNTSTQPFAPYINVIAGDTYKLFVSVDWYTQPGTHKFTLSFQGDAVTSHPDLFNYPGCATMSIEDNTNEEVNVSVYPNPFSDSFTISSPQTFEKVVLYNVLGKQIHEQKYATTIKVANLSQGVYFLHLLDAEGKKVVRKVVKE